MTITRTWEGQSGLLNSRPARICQNCSSGLAGPFLIEVRSVKPSGAPRKWPNGDNTRLHKAWQSKRTGKKPA